MLQVVLINFAHHPQWTVAPHVMRVSSDGGTHQMILFLKKLTEKTYWQKLEASYKFILHVLYPFRKCCLFYFYNDKSHEESSPESWGEFTKCGNITQKS